MYVAVNQPSVVALLAGIMALSYGQLMNNELVPSTLNEGLSVKHFEMFNECITLT